jgi:hypothetical protein
MAPFTSPLNPSPLTTTQQPDIQNSVAGLRQATEQAAATLLQSFEAQHALRRRVAELEAELQKAKAQESRALKEAGQAKRDLEEEKRNHDQHVKKVKENFNSEWKSKYEEVQKRYDSENQAFEKAIIDARELKKSNDNRLRENKGQQRRITADQERYTKEIHSLKEDNAEPRDDIREAEIKIKSLFQELKTIREELDAHINLGDSLVAENAEWKVRADDFARLEEIQSNLAEKTFRCRELEAELQEQKLSTKQLEHIEDTKALCRRQIATIDDLRAQVADLQEDREVKESLVRNGAAIRIRYMIQARDKLFKDSAEDSDAEFVKVGNSAAHGGDGLADESLFLAGFLDRDKWSKVLKLYMAEFIHCPPGLRKARNCHATIQVVQPVKRARSTTQQRREAQLLLATINTEYESYGGAAENGEIVGRYLKWLETLTDKIVEVDRGRSLLNYHFWWLDAAYEVG